jgi:hypothetical protein
VAEAGQGTEVADRPRRRGGAGRCHGPAGVSLVGRAIWAPEVCGIIFRGRLPCP